MNEYKLEKADDENYLIKKITNIVNHFIFEHNITTHVQMFNLVSCWKNPVPYIDAFQTYYFLDCYQVLSDSPELYKKKPIIKHLSKKQYKKIVILNITNTFPTSRKTHTVWLYVGIS